MAYESELSPDDAKILEGYGHVNTYLLDDGGQGTIVHVHTLIDCDSSEWNQVYGVTESGELIDMGSE